MLPFLPLPHPRDYQLGREVRPYDVKNRQIERDRQIASLVSVAVEFRQRAAGLAMSNTCWPAGAAVRTAPKPPDILGAPSCRRRKLQRKSRVLRPRAREKDRREESRSEQQADAETRRSAAPGRCGIACLPV